VRARMIHRPKDGAKDASVTYCQLRTNFDANKSIAFR